MLSRDRRAILAALACAGLTGCFRPMLAKDEAARALQGNIALPDVQDRFSYFLTESLTERLGKPKEPDYRLEIATSVSQQGLAIAQDNSVTRVTLLAEASWSLWRRGGTAAVMSDVVRSQSGYNATTSLFATRQIRQDIERRLARDLGERISRKILARSEQLNQ